MDSNIIIAILMVLVFICFFILAGAVDKLQEQVNSLERKIRYPDWQQERRGISQDDIDEMLSKWDREGDILEE